MTTESNSKTKVALLGLGVMGGGMARQLLESGYDLTVYNRSSEKAKPLAEKGARIGATPAEAAAGADAAIAMLADDVASRESWLGPYGALDSLGENGLIIECSTLTVGWAKELAGEATKRGRAFIDAPVTGSRPQAASGELKFFVGGRDEDVARARPYLEAMGSQVTHLGPVGNGALFKLVNNFLCSVQVASLAEAIALIERSDLNAEKTLQALAAGAPGSPIIKGMGEKMLERKYELSFDINLMIKDIGYAIEQGRTRASPLKTAEAALAVFKNGISGNLGPRDLSSVVEQFR